VCTKTRGLGVHGLMCPCRNSLSKLSSSATHRMLQSLWALLAVEVVDEHGNLEQVELCDRCVAVALFVGLLCATCGRQQTSWQAQALLTTGSCMSAWRHAVSSWPTMP
jgi:hypothetical protein